MTGTGYKAPITTEELELFLRVTEIEEAEVASFCIELELIPDDPFVIHDLIDPIFDRLVERATTEGLPISKYDAEDLSQFQLAELTAFARALGVRVNPNHSSDAVIAAIVGKMKRVCKKLPKRSVIPLMVTYFLPALVRHFSQP